METSHPPDVAFGDYRIDARSRRLLRSDGSAVRLTQRAFDTLLVLVEHAGQTVDKRRLMALVWPQAVVEENNLNQCIAAIRKALGDHSDAPRYVLTVPGRGYRFIADVRTEPLVAANAVASVSPQTPTMDVEPQPVARARAALAWGAGVALVGLLGFAVLPWRGSDRQGPVTRPEEYRQLTFEPSAAVAPALSRDGRLLAYIRGDGMFLAKGQLVVKALPDGDPVTLTPVEDRMFAPAFDPGGARIAYTRTNGVSVPSKWATWTVSVLGGASTPLLPNASGASWLAPDRLLYSEVQSGIHMGIVASSESRAGHVLLYLPPAQRSMAHFSFPSPDRKTMLVVEMQQGHFTQCRLVAMAGRSPDRQVGPPGVCTAAAWSPNGEWMYFSSRQDRDHYHLWRQRFPDGTPEQITFGPNSELGVMPTPDGRALLTSLGGAVDTLTLHDAGGAHPLRLDGNSDAPWLSDDGTRLYFIAQVGADTTNHLRLLDLRTGLVRDLLPGQDVDAYAISRDERDVAFVLATDRKPQLWLAPLDHHAAPRLLQDGADQPKFDARGRLYYRLLGTPSNALERRDDAQAQPVRVVPQAILDFHAISPDSAWIVATYAQDGHTRTSMLAAGSGEPRFVQQDSHYPHWNWSRDGKLLYVDLPKDAAKPDAGTAIWALPTTSDGLPAQLSAFVPGAQRISDDIDAFVPGPTPALYVLQGSQEHSNIFSIPLH